MLGYATRHQLDGFLKVHGVDQSFTLAEIGRQVEGLKRLGLQMRVVVADTTSARYLAEIGYLEFLPRLFETIFIPLVVYQELQHPASPAIVRAAFNPPPRWLQIVATEAIDDDSILMALDDGEGAAPALGLSLRADLILIDERKGADARLKGLEFTGTLGILILAAQRQWIDLAEAFEGPRQTNFYCSENLMRSLLSRVFPDAFYWVAFIERKTQATESCWNSVARLNPPFSSPRMRCADGRAGILFRRSFLESKREALIAVEDLQWRPNVNSRAMPFTNPSWKGIYS